MNIPDHIVAARVWKVTAVLNGSGTAIAILDTAVNEQDPSLNHKVTYYKDCFQGPVIKTKHGTVCASIAVGAHDGVAPHAKLYVYRIAEYSSRIAGTANCLNLAVIAALDDIMEKKKCDVQIDVVSMSFALQENANQELEIHRKISALAAMGVTFVAAGGNLSRFEPIAPIPARFKDCVISVGALDRRGNESDSTSRGRIDVWAPGEDITKDALQGTSFATPVIAGLILLLKQWAKIIGPPASEHIHRVQVLRHIFSEDMMQEPERGNEKIFYPLKLVKNFWTQKEILHEIATKHAKEFIVDTPMEVNNP